MHHRTIGAIPERPRARSGPPDGSRPVGRMGPEPPHGAWDLSLNAIVMTEMRRHASVGHGVRTTGRRLMSARPLEGAGPGVRPTVIGMAAASDLESHPTPDL
jgi:hypothetical protein